MENFGSRYFRGQGKVFIGDRDANGKAVNLLFVGDVSSLDLTPNIETSEKIENVTGSNGIGSSFTKSTEFEMAMNMSSIKPQHLAIALQGSATANIAGSVTDEAHTANLDKFIALQFNKVDTVVVTGSGGTPTYVENTDYVVHADEGMIEFISGGTITDGTAVLIDYNYAAQNHIKIDPNNADKYLVFAGKNSADNDKQTRCELYKVKLDPGALPAITEDAVDISVTGKVLVDSLRAAGDQFYSWKTED